MVDTLEEEELEEEELEEEELTEDAEEMDERVDVRPKPPGLVSPIEEQGMSVDPDDLGRQWLGTATEQGNFESSSTEPDEGAHITTDPNKE